MPVETDERDYAPSPGETAQDLFCDLMAIMNNPHDPELAQTMQEIGARFQALHDRTFQRDADRRAIYLNYDQLIVRLLEVIQSIYQLPASEYEDPSI